MKKPDRPVRSDEELLDWLEGGQGELGGWCIDRYRDGRLYLCTAMRNDRRYRLTLREAINAAIDADEKVGVG